MVAAATSGKTTNLRDVRVERVPVIKEEILAEHQEASRGYRDLADYRRELLPNLQHRRVVAICSHGPFNPNEILGNGPGIYNIIRSAGAIRDERAWALEMAKERARAKEGNQMLWILDLVHPGCPGLDYSDSLGYRYQNIHQRIIQDQFPDVFYTRGELDSDTADLRVWGDKPGKEEIIFDCQMAEDAVPAECLDSETRALQYISQAILATGGFNPKTIFPLAQAFRENVNHRKRRLGNKPQIPDHEERWGVTGRGTAWMSRSVFTVTASVDNEHLFSDVERSMLVGIGLMDEIVPHEDPIIWLCSETYDESPNGKPRHFADGTARQLAQRVKRLPRLQPWQSTNRLVVIPALVARESSHLEILD